MYNLVSKTSILIFEGSCRIALNAKIRVQSGVLRIGNGVRIGTDTKVICNGGKITIGEYTGITFAYTIMNSSFHYTYDIEEKRYVNRTNTIEIGKYNWIGNQTTILGKCKTKDYTIVGTGSLSNHNYKKYEGDYPLLAGRPAKLIRIGIKRIFSPYIEQEISKLFNIGQSHEKIVDKPEDIKIEM